MQEKKVKEMVRASCNFGTAPRGQTQDEKILFDAVEAGGGKLLLAMAEKRQFTFITVEEALDLSKKLPVEMAQDFWDLSVSPLLRGYLVRELERGEHSGEKGKLLLQLLKVYWRPERDDGFELVAES